MKNFIIKKLFSLNRKLKLMIIFFLDLLIILFSTYGSLAIRFDQLNLFDIVDERYLITFEFFLIPIISYFTIAIFFKFYSYSFRQYNLGSYIFSSFPLIGLSILLLNFIFNEYFSFGAALINIILILLFIILSRKFISKIFNIFQKKNQKNILIVCSSKNIHKIYTYLKFNQNLNIRAISVVDFHKIDFSMYQNFKIKDVENIDSLIEDFDIKRIISDKNYRNLKNKFSRKVAIDVLDDSDLVKNVNIDYKQQFINHYFKLKNKVKFKLSNQYANKIILITGAGGSIGKNLFYELLNSHAKKIILVDQDELKLFHLIKNYETKQITNKNNIDINFKLGNLCDEFFLDEIFSGQDKIDIVLHAAAYKHVGLGEENILCFIKNNIFLTYDLAKKAINHRIKKFIFISTDKAVNPKSIMGFSKNFCEKSIIYLNKKHDLKNVFSIVRFGNVINSDGSVLPIFEKQILNGEDVTVTHSKVTRYFMTISNACQLVLKTIDLKKNIGIFILDMGKPYKIINIAKSMINYYVKNKIAIKESKIVIIGLQHGEKIHEELVLGKNLKKTVFKNILYADEKQKITKSFDKILTDLKKACLKIDIKNIKLCLKNNV
tara:strand:- start:6365 stop:8179 length:1815 start_codon:yes stop_codon:yes gene_type:complete